MIVREYYQNINVRLPRNYFEKWYADMWHRRIGKTSVTFKQFYPILEEELKKVGATYDHINFGFKFRVCFDNDKDYAMFILKWA